MDTSRRRTGRMKDRMDAGHKGFITGESRTGRMQDRTDEGHDACQDELGWLRNSIFKISRNTKFGRNYFEFREILQK